MDEARESDRPFETLGARLAREARRRETGRVPAFPWLPFLAKYLDRLAALPTPAESRYARVEAPLVLPELANRQVWLSDVPTESVNEPSRAPRDLPLPAALRSRLVDIAGEGSETARIHVDAAAERLARDARADAVTVGQDVYVRPDAYRPDEDRGFALLAHEMVHVAHAHRSDASDQRSTASGRAEEERAALWAEGLALRRAPFSWPDPRVAAVAAPEQGLLWPSQREVVPDPRAPHAVEATRGKSAGKPSLRAAIDRKTDPPAAPIAPAMDLERLRRTLYRDLLRQLKSDFARGG